MLPLVRQKPLLLILPAFYLLVTGVFLINWMPFYMNDPDPVYIYLFNGMTIASGNLKVFYIDNPGIPVQYFCAIVIYITHFFNHGIPLYQDVLLHPERYLYTLSVVISLGFVFTTWLAGRYLLKRTGNLVLALLFQLTCLIGNVCLYAQNPTPESLIIIGGIFFMAYLYYHSVFASTHLSLRHVIIYGAFLGFLVACKYTCLPLLLLVLIVLPSFRLRAQFTGSFILFFFIFIAPALPAWKNMIEWVYNLSIHTGKYGQGEVGIIDPHMFFTHLGDLFKEDFYFTSIYILMTILLLVAFVRRKKIKKENTIYVRLLSGVWVSSSLLMLLVSKHYSFLYLLPVRLCFPLAIAGSYKLLKDILPLQLPHRFISVAFYTFFGFLLLTHIKTPIVCLTQPVSYTTSDFLNKYPTMPLIVNTNFQCSRIEPSLDFGNAYCAAFRYKYWDFLKKTYPYFYQYQPSENTITHWDDVFYIPELLSKYHTALVYFYHIDSTQRNSALANFCNWNNTIKLGNYTCIYTRPESDEYVYQVSDSNNNSSSLLANYTETDFDFEKLTPDRSAFISSDGNSTFNGIDYTNTTEHHSGNNSILLDAKNPSTIIRPIKAFPGYIVSISIWRKSDDRKSYIVFSSKTDGDFYTSGQAVIDSGANGWKQIEYKCIVPNSIKDSNIMFYLYYNGEGKAYFDDLSIKTFSMKLNNPIFVKKD